MINSGLYLATYMFPHLLIFTPHPAGFPPMGLSCFATQHLVVAYTTKRFFALTPLGDQIINMVCRPHHLSMYNFIGCWLYCTGSSTKARIRTLLESLHLNLVFVKYTIVDSGNKSLSYLAFSRFQGVCSGCVTNADNYITDCLSL